MSKQQGQPWRWADHPPLRSIQLENFKSVLDQDVGLGMLTVLVGKNSAGKSTMLDSILMRSQAGIDFAGHDVPLNGELINLGSFDDVLSATRRGDSIARIGAVISVNSEEGAEPARPRTRMLALRRRGGQGSRTRSAPRNRFLFGVEVALRELSRQWRRRMRQPSELTIRWSIGFHCTDPTVVSSVVTFPEVACCDLSLASESDGILASASVRALTAEGMPRPAFLEHIPAGGRSIEYRPTGEEVPSTFGEVAGGSDSGGPICDAALVDGLPDAVRVALDAKRFVAKELVDLWLRHLAFPEAGLQNLSSALPEPTDFLDDAADTSSADAFLGEPSANEKAARQRKRLADLLEQAARWADFYFEHVVGNEVLEELAHPGPSRWRGMGGRQRPADFFEGLGIRPKGTVQEASRAVAKAQEVLRANRRDGAKAKAPLVDRLYVAIGVEAEDLGEVEVKEVRAALLEATALDEGGPEGPYEGLYERVEAAMAPGERGTVVVRSDEFNHAISALRRAVQEFMVNNVEHIGPLRVEPRAVYNTGRHDRLPKVGQTGENTAAVLANSADLNVVCPKKDGDPEEMPLADAIRYWLGRDGLELADDIRSQSFGAAGYVLEVKPPGVDKWLKLMGVGTGVSQVLPVLVQGLLSDPGSVLILQQPELHLHPALQQDLGDFLMACAKSGKQVLLETHSEYLISRLARRVAEGSTDGDVVKLLLVEHSQDAGTTYEPAAIDEYGTIAWPEGFFEEAADEAFKILDAGLARQSDLEG